MIYIVKFDENGESFGFMFVKEMPENFEENESFVEADQVDTSKPLMWQKDSDGNITQIEAHQSVAEKTKRSNFYKSEFKQNILGGFPVTIRNEKYWFSGDKEREVTLYANQARSLSKGLLGGNANLNTVIPFNGNYPKLCLLADGGAWIEDVTYAEILDIEQQMIEGLQGLQQWLDDVLTCIKTGGDIETIAQPISKDQFLTNN